MTVRQGVDAVRDAEDFLEFGGDDDDGLAFFDHLVDEGVDLELRANINAARGFIKNEDVCVRVEPLGQNDLLLVATRQGAGLLEDRVGADVHSILVVGGDGQFLMSIDEASA